MKRKRFFNFLVCAILICSTSVFTACSNKEENTDQPDLHLSEKLIGKWMVVELDDEPCPTNLKTVITFESPTKAHGSLSDIYSNTWNVQVNASVKINKNNVRLVSQIDEYVTNLLDATVISITDNDMVLSTDWSLLVNGEEVHREVYSMERWERVKNNYHDAILGTWEGKVTSGEDDHTDGEWHRWEYRADGTYVYYSKENDEWEGGSDFLSEYFVDGTLLCTRWQETATSEEKREWWEIESISGGVMKWKALRVHEDGSNYIATFEMKRIP